MASNAPGYEEPQCFVVDEEVREAALQTVTASVEYLEGIPKQAGELEWQRFAPLFNWLEETWGLSYQPLSPPPSPVSASEQKEQEMGESAGFDEGSDDDDESEE